jgi:DNA-binding transcriptional ArsR family regulator
VLQNGPLNVGAISEATGLSQSNTSMHLDLLRECGLLERERDGRRVFYSVRGESVTNMLSLATRIMFEEGPGASSIGTPE